MTNYDMGQGGFKNAVFCMTYFLINLLCLKTRTFNAFNGEWRKEKERNFGKLKEYEDMK